VFLLAPFHKALSCVAQSPLLDAYEQEPNMQEEALGITDDTFIGLTHAHFTWSKPGVNKDASAKLHFVLSIDGELIFKPKSINLIIGESCVLYLQFPHPSLVRARGIGEDVLIDGALG
jgi:hypothetical protein